MKVAIIGTAGIPASYGGFETLAEYLVKYLSKDFEIKVYCSGKKSEENLIEYNGAILEYIPLNANGVQSIPYDIIATCKALLYADVLLILGVSGCVFLPFVRLISKKRILVNIDGLEWKRAKWGKWARKFLKYSEKIAVKMADVVIADNKVIQQHVMDSYGKESKLIAYGADHTNKLPLTDEIENEYPFLRNRYAFKVCRIEPENNVHVILEAYTKCSKLNLVIVGNWDNSEYGQGLKLKYKGFKNIYLLDSIYDQNKLNRIRSNCNLYVHGHSAGGTNPSLVEAMFLGLPILSFDVNYNRETTNKEALYFKDETELIALLCNLENLDLNLVAKNLKRYADENYSWDFISNEYRHLFLDT
mgnify:CR=1 FL=1|tara:strand:+ start:48528 stop:49607 length:1080 start_codon:yes stop_codon:yes gene_type:complete